MMEARTVLKYPGAKWAIADWIISLMPPHKSYLEPFFGSGAVFFRKPPSRIETINDLDGEIVNLFTVIREQPEALARAVAMTPYSREEYDRAWERLAGDAHWRPEQGRESQGCDVSQANEQSGLCDDDVEWARLVLVKYWQTHGSCNRYKSGWKNDRAGREYAYAVKYWNQLPGWIMEAVGRLKEAQIEHMPAVEVIRRFRSPEVLVYADPPYVLQTRKQRMYRVEMDTDAGHMALLEALKDHPGPVMLSGYDNELYNDLLLGWDKLQTTSQCEMGGKRVETLWVNFEVQGSLFGRGLNGLC